MAPHLVRAGGTGAECDVFAPIFHRFIDFSSIFPPFRLVSTRFAPIFRLFLQRFGLKSGEEWVSLSTELPSEESTDSGDVELLENLEELYSGSIPDIAACIERAPGCASALGGAGAGAQRLREGGCHGGPHATGRL